MNTKLIIGFWILFAITGIGIIINTGATFSSVTCATGEVVGNIKQCPQCNVDSDCQEDGNLDMVCSSDLKCKPRYCMGITECQDTRSLCEFNQCMFEEDIAELINGDLE